MAGTSIIEVRVAGTGTDVNPGGSSGSSGSSGLLGAGSKLGILAGAAMAVVGLLKDMLWVFKPVLNVLKMIARTLGLFLEPIAQLLFLLIQPLLAFLKPLTMLFRAMMAPVMNLLRQQSAVMSQQMGAGDYIGASQTGIDMIGLAMGGFFIAMADVIGTMLINIVGNLLKTLSISLIEGLYTLIRPLLDVFLGNKAMSVIDESVTTFTDSLSTSFGDGITYATESLHTGTNEMMNALIGYYTTKLAETKTTIETDFPGVIAPFTDVITNTAESVPGQVTIMETNINTALKGISTDTTTYMTAGGSSSIPSTFSSGLQLMELSMQVFAESTVEYGTKIANALSSAQSSASKARAVQIGLINIG